jgi:(S)-3,5-dihydroxyphenylglycine transaminase
MTTDASSLPTADLELGGLHPSLQDPALTSMNLLNEITGRFPDALSFAPGRPYEQFFDLDSLPRYLQLFREHLAGLGQSPEQVRRTLCQYGRTKGIVHDLVARHLAQDEGLVVDPDSVVVTVGCQEAMFLVVRALRRDARDVVLSVEPNYVGFTGAALLVDVPVLPVSGGGDRGVDLDDLVARIRQARRDGLRPRACYLTPDFANPTGLRMDLATRRELLAIAEREDILLLEDNAYGVFDGGQEPIPTLKALDTGRRVVYLGSFAKTVFPGARVGYVVADQLVGRRGDGAGATTLLADELSKIKSMLTVNTSPIAQAVAAGRLLEYGCSLRRANAEVREVYRDNRARILAGLTARFGHRDDVSWNVPEGGFFIVVTVPFEVDDALLELSAARYGVLWTPMRHFYSGAGGERQLRLSCSSLDAAQIEVGLDRLAAFFADRGVTAAPGDGTPPTPRLRVVADRAAGQ